jgi:hypothetical protein
MNEIKISYQDFQDISVYAFRYALGRTTYAVSDMAEFLIRHKDDLSENSRFVIKRDINTAFKRKQYGMECDRHEWEKVLGELE